MKFFSKKAANKAISEDDGHLGSSKEEIEKISSFSAISQDSQDNSKEERQMLPVPSVSSNKQYTPQSPDLSLNLSPDLLLDYADRTPKKSVRLELTYFMIFYAS